MWLSLIKAVGSQTEEAKGKALPRYFRLYGLQLFFALLMKSLHPILFHPFRFEEKILTKRAMNNVSFSPKDLSSILLLAKCVTSHTSTV